MIFAISLTMIITAVLDPEYVPMITLRQTISDTHMFVVAGRCIELKRKGEQTPSCMSRGVIELRSTTAPKQ
jgi:hypothetical protein